jgi:hypothetical protein
MSVIRKPNHPFFIRDGILEIGQVSEEAEASLLSATKV